MKLYPETLFHFTDKESLKGILSNNFKVFYSKECLIGPDGEKIEYAVPMVSFCDLKLSEIHDHINSYGYYGIGLKKSWALENGLNPVIYLNHKNSFLFI